MMQPGWTVSGADLWQWRSIAQQQAIAADVPVAEVDWLLQALAGLDRLSLRLGSFRDKPEISLNCPLAELDQRWQTRINARIPVQYLAGATPWRNFLLQVSPTVLIPRPETECLIDLAIAAVQANPDLAQGHWVDLGTGSGAIALGLAAALPQAQIHAVDASAAALDMARRNAQIHHLDDRIQFYQGSWFEPLSHLRGGLSGMVSNPPYIPTGILAGLQPEVVQHEPHLALDGGEDGLTAIRHLIQTAPDYLRSGGVWLIEMMAGQPAAVMAELQSQGNYEEIQIRADLAGIDRFALAKRI